MNRRTFFAGLFALPAAVRGVLGNKPEGFVREYPMGFRFIKSTSTGGCTLTSTQITRLTPNDIISLGESEQRVTGALRQLS